ncbi:hypothetical protein GCM10011378_06590 [Hymenobacter glacieicola]|uniref:Uncharacterized protein n=1 Tax=Hymenobacter glacieicola TaxID=1562124 RepID=A0ABQ1WJN4_9BACT|nr:hypothetical protein GCM10011378_06590 [Hymenobacter glacieicola]
MESGCQLIKASAMRCDIGLAGAAGVVWAWVDREASSRPERKKRRESMGKE